MIESNIKSAILKQVLRVYKVEIDKQESYVPRIRFNIKVKSTSVHLNAVNIK